MCYSGSRHDAVPYFAELGYECPHDVNPSEYFIDLVTIDTEDHEQSDIDNKRIDFLHSKFLESSTLDSNAVSVEYLPGKMLSPSKTVKGIGLIPALRSKVNSLNCISRRFNSLLRRSWRQNSRNLPVNLIRLSASVVQAIMFATIFSSIQEGMLFKLQAPKTFQHAE